jgi:hypothetical protein
MSLCKARPSTSNMAQAMGATLPHWFVLPNSEDQESWIKEWLARSGTRVRPTLEANERRKSERKESRIKDHCNL